MAEQQPQIPNAPFPAPPPFWKHFTTENLSRLQAIREAENAQSEQLPPELTYLEPPPPPSDTYTIFGEEHTLSSDLPTLSSRGVTQLYPSSPDLDHSHYLLLVLRSLHLTFEESLIILARNPAFVFQKMEDIKNLFQNAHWLINIYRPHQARETLIAMMEEEIEEGRREMAECDRVKAKAQGLLRDIETQAEKIASDKKSSAAIGTADAARRDEKARRLWQMMQEIKIDDTH